MISGLLHLTVYDLVKTHEVKMFLTCCWNTKTHANLSFAFLLCLLSSPVGEISGKKYTRVVELPSIHRKNVFVSLNPKHLKTNK